MSLSVYLSYFNKMITSRRVIVFLLVCMILFSINHYEVSSSFPIVYPPVDNNETTTPLFVSLIMSFGYNGAFNSSGTIPGIEIALDLVNNHTDLLPGYKLHYVLMDSQCNHEVALDVLFKELFTENTQRIGIIGAGCSVATEPTAEISHYYNITQVSCASSSHLLANRDKYRAYFQMLPSSFHLTPAIVSVCKQYQWRHVAIIGQAENLFLTTVDRLEELFINENITWNLRTFETSSGPLSLGNGLFEERARIFFLAMYPTNALTVICQAYKTGRIYPRYSFILYGWYSPNWWIPSSANFPCTRQEIESVLHYSIAVLQHQFGTNTSQESDAGISYVQYDTMYQSRVQKQGYRVSTHSVQCFDGVWSFALALNKTITELSMNATLNMLAKLEEGTHNNDTEFRIEDATYNNNILQQTMFKYLEMTDFKGITGEVSFTDLGIRRVNRLRVFQYRYTQRENGTMVFGPVEFASVSALNYSALQYYSGESDITVWPSGVIPYDGKAENKTTSVAIPITVIYSLCALGGIAYSVSCLLFIITCRNNKLIRLTSPKLNILVISGAIIMYLSVILYTIPSYDELGTTILCNIQPRVFSIGYTLCFATILAKMWRVYYIFTNPKPSRKAIKDWHLALFVFTAVIIDVFLLIILTVFNGGRTRAVLVTNMEDSSDEKGELGYRTDYYTYICESREHNIWLGIIFGYKGLLQVAALFLAFGIRKVKMKGLNDSTFVGLTVYISSIIITVQVIVSIVLNQYLNTFAALLGTCITINATVILGLLFIPQMINVYKDPEGKHIYTSAKTPDGTANVLKSAVPGLAETSFNTPKAASKGNDTGFQSMSSLNNIYKDIVQDPFMKAEDKIVALIQKIEEMEQKYSVEKKI